MSVGVAGRRAPVAAHGRRAARRVMTRSVAVDLDGALGDTRPLWDDWLAAAGAPRHRPRPTCRSTAARPLPSSTGAAQATGGFCSSASPRNARPCICGGTRRRARRWGARGGRLRGRRVHGRPGGARARGRSRSSAPRGASSRSRPAQARSSGCWRRLGADAVVVRSRERAPRAGCCVESSGMESKDVGDRQLDALLERLDRIARELER